MSPPPTRQTGGRPLTAPLGGVAIAGGVIVAISPSFTWFPGTASSSGAWSGFGLYADRVELDIEGNALMMGFDADGWFNAMFGPAAPLVFGIALVFGGLLVIVRRARMRQTWAAPWSAVIALASLGAAGITAGSGVDPGGDIGGAGLRTWVIGSAIGAVALGVELARHRPPPLSAAVARAIVDWVAIPAVLLGGASAALLVKAEELHPFATWRVLTVATLAAALPAAGTVAALLAVAPPDRPMIVTLVNASALVLTIVLFALWTQVALV